MSRIDIAQSKRLYRKVTMKLMPILLIGYVFACLDRVNVSFAKLQMQADLQFGDMVYGLGAGIFFVGYFLFEVPSNLMLHRFGARRWIARIMISWGLISAAMAFVRSPTEFYVLRFALGVAEAGFFPGIIYYFTKWYPSNHRGSVTGTFMVGAAVAGILGGPLSGWIMQDMNGWQGLQGWQWMFLLEGVPAALYGILILRLLDDDIASAGWLTPEEKRELESALQAERKNKLDIPLAALLKDSRIWLFSLVSLLITLGTYTIAFWSPQMIKNLGVSDLLHVGLLSALPWIAAAIGMIGVGKSADRMNERHWHVALPALVGGAGLALAASAGSPVLGLIGLVVAGFGLFATISQFWSLPTQLLTGAGAAAGIALINSISNLGGFFGPGLIGALGEWTGDISNGVYVVASCQILVAALVLLPGRSRAPSVGESEVSASGHGR